MLKDIFSAADIIPLTGKELQEFIKKMSQESGIIIEWGEDRYGSDNYIKDDWAIDILEKE